MRIIRYILFIIVGLSLCSVVKAQSYMMLLNELDSGSWDFYKGLYPLPNGDFLISGETKRLFVSDSTQYSRVTIDKIKKNGVLEKRNYYGADSGYHLFEEIPKWFEIGGRPAILVTSYSALYPLNTKMHLYIYDSNGDTIGTRLVDDLPINSYGIEGLTFNKQSEIVLTIRMGKYYGDSFFICAIDTTGRLKWFKEHPLIRGINVRSMVQTSDGGYLLAGEDIDSNRYGFKDGFPIYVGHPMRLWLGKFDSIGRELWQKTFTGEYYEPRGPNYEARGPDTHGAFFSEIIALSNGTYLGCGGVNFYPYLVNINQEGKILWENKYDSLVLGQHIQGFPREFLGAVVEWENNLYALGGRDRSDDMNIVYKFDLKGNRKWKRVYSYQRDVHNILYYLQMVENEMVLLGTARDSLKPENLKDAWLLKLDTNGCMVPGCHLTDSSKPIEGNKKIKAVEIYPNPVNDELFITLPSNSIYTYNLYDSFGKKISSGMLNAPLGQISMVTLMGGIYFIEFTDENMVKQYKKVLVNH